MNKRPASAGADLQASGAELVNTKSEITDNFGKLHQRTEYGQQIAKYFQADPANHDDAFDNRALISGKNAPSFLPRGRNRIAIKRSSRRPTGPPGNVNF